MKHIIQLIVLFAALLVWGIMNPHTPSESAYARTLSVANGANTAAPRISSATKTSTATMTPTASRTPVISVPTPFRPVLRVTGNLESIDGYSDPWNLLDIPSSSTFAIAQVSLGSTHALALNALGKITGWGFATNAELTIPTLGPAAQVAASKNWSAALLQSGNLAVWGSPAYKPETVPTSNDFVQLVACAEHMIALRSNGTVLTLAPSARTAVFPLASLNGKTIRGVACANNSIGVGQDGAVFMWGTLPGGITQIPASASGSVIRVFAGTSTKLANKDIYAVLKADGTLILFGAVEGVIPSVQHTVEPSTTAGCPCIRIPSMGGIRSVSVTSYGVVVINRLGKPIVFPYASGGDPVPYLPNRIIQMSQNATGQGAYIVEPADVVVQAPTATAAIALQLRQPNERNAVGTLAVWGGDLQIQTIPVEAQQELRQVVAGRRHIAVLTSAGGVVTWGNNSYDQLSVPSEVAQERPWSDPLRVIALAAGANHTLALLQNKTVIAWGDNEFNQSSVPTTLRNVVQIAAGARHSVALLADGTVVSWGDNTYGQLNQPTMSGVAKIAAGDWHTIALRQNQTAVGWGRNTEGQLTFSTVASIIDVAATRYTSVLLLKNGKVVSAGDDTDGLLMAPDVTFQYISSGSTHILGITTAGSIVGWGNNSSDQLVVPANLIRPFQVVGGQSFSAALALELGTQPTGIPVLTATRPRIPPLATIVAPPVSSLVTLSGVATNTSTGSLIAYGEGITATIGLNGAIAITRNADSPLCDLPVGIKRNATQILIGTYTYVVSSNRTLTSWGGCDGGVVANIVNNTSSIPAAFQSNIAEISVRGSHVVVRTVDGRVWSNLIDVTQRTDIRHIAAGATFVVELTNAGQVLVFDTAANQSVSAVPTTAVNIIEIAAGINHIVALRNDRRVIAWGADTNDMGQADIPFQALSNVIAITAGNRSSFALQANGTVIAWGDVAAQTIDALVPFSDARTVVGVFEGAGKIGLLIDGAASLGTLTRTVRPSMTAVNLTPKPTTVASTDPITDLIGWFHITNPLPKQAFQSRIMPYSPPGMSFTCSAAATCPQQIARYTDAENMNYALQFKEASNDELMSAVALDLSTTSFTVAFKLRRTINNREDVVASIGTPGIKNKYLTIGIDANNHPYCGFYANDLKSTLWFTDAGWHSYACSFDRTTRMRTLYRDGYVIAQDATQLDFTPPATAKLVIGRRYDTMAGLEGALDTFEVYSRALTKDEVIGWQEIMPSETLVRMSFDEASLQGKSPNRSVLTCGDGIECPIIVNDANSRNDEFIKLSSSGYFFTPARPLTSFTLAGWIKPSSTSGLSTVFSQYNESGVGFRMYFDATTQWIGCEYNSDPMYSPQTFGISFADLPALDFQDWQFYTCVYDAQKSMGLFYLNGKVISVASVTIAPWAGQLKIGGPANWMSYPGNAYVDDFLVYASALSPQNVIAAYNMTNPTGLMPTFTPSPSTYTPVITKTYTPTASSTQLPAARARPSRIPATPTSSVVAVIPFPATRTSTASATVRPSSTQTTTLSPTVTNTVIPTPVPFTSTRTMTLTRTPLIITRTWMARPTETAGSFTTPSNTRTSTRTRTASATSTPNASMTAIRTSTRTLTQTAYPLPTDTPTAYPTP